MFACFDIKKINQNLDVPEDAILLVVEVSVHVRLLTTAIPQVQHQVAEKLHIRIIHIHCVLRSRKI